MQATGAVSKAPGAQPKAAKPAAVGAQAAPAAVGAKATPGAPPAAVGAKATAPAAAAVGAKATTPAADPPLPKSWAELSEGSSPPDMSCEAYVVILVGSVKERLQKLLGQPPAVGGMNLQTPLSQMEPLKITAKPKELGSFKEHWRWESCEVALGTHGLYEAPGNVFWLSITKPAWDGKELPATELTFGQVAAGRLMFSDEKFRRSSPDDPAKRHYFINFAVPTAVVSLTDVPKKDGQGFVNLPCLGSLSALAGFFSVLDDALRANDLQKIRKLYEAALTMPMRLRSAPSFQQVCLDSITYSEDLWAAKSASSDSFLAFAAKAVSLFPSEPAVGGLPLKEVQARLEKLGVTFHGVKVGENAARAILYVAPYVHQVGIRDAFMALEDITQKLNDQTNVSMVFNIASKTFGKGSPAAVGALEEIAAALRISLLFKDIAKDSHLNKEFLVGKSKKARK